jgi:ATP-dependent protease ClpP protease subunit
VGHVELSPIAANRWIAREHIDDNTCQPCRDNDGKLYKNRADAYADYPDGKGYVNCVGAEYGNKCRGKVNKRREGRAMTPEQLAAIEGMRASAGLFSARAFTSVSGPTEKLRVEPLASANTTAFYLYDYIGGYDGVTALDVVEALAGAQGDIDLHINSGGGSIFEGSAMYAAFDNYQRGTVRTYIDGVAASAASYVALAGEEIIIEPAATMMIHAGSGGVFGTAKEMRAQADVLDLLTSTMAGLYAARTGTPVATWLETLNSGDTWYSAASAIEAGLATRLGGSKKTVPAPEPDSDESVPTDNLLSAMLAAFSLPTDKTLVAPVPRIKPAPAASIDVTGIRNALKGIMA